MLAPVGPRDHVRSGEGAEAIVYLDPCCPHCAAVWPRLDVERFEAERRSEGTIARVRDDTESGLAAGVADRLAIFRDGRAVEPDAL